MCLASVVPAASRPEGLISCCFVHPATSPQSWHRLQPELLPPPHTQTHSVADLMACCLQIFAGTRDHSVVAWEPPKQQLEETVSLGGHTGWVRSLATSGQWLFSASCSMVRSLVTTSVSEVAPPCKLQATVTLSRASLVKSPLSRACGSSYQSFLCSTVRVLCARAERSHSAMLGSHPCFGASAGSSVGHEPRCAAAPARRERREGRHPGPEHGQQQPVRLHVGWQHPVRSQLKPC